VFAITLTLAAIMWVKALHHQWFSTMYGVYYFAGAVWTTIATVYVITIALQRTGPLREVVHEETYYFLGSLQLAFTVFYAYIHFSQYFIIWYGNIPRRRSGKCCATRSGGTLVSSTYSGIPFFRFCCSAH